MVEPTVRWVFNRQDFEQTLERALEKILRVVIVVGAIAVGASMAGFTAFLGGSALIVAALTLAVGFAAQDVLSNFVAGVFIVQDRNFDIDDWIEWDGKAGFIEDIGFRVTRIRTFDNETITVPNTELATNAVTNRMGNDTLRISYSVGIGYGDDIDETTRILTDAAADHDAIVCANAGSDERYEPFNSVVFHRIDGILTGNRQEVVRSPFGLAECANDRIRIGDCRIDVRAFLRVTLYHMQTRVLKRSLDADLTNATTS